MSKIEEAGNRQRSGNLLSYEITDLLTRARQLLIDRMNYNVMILKDKQFVSEEE
jgi:hypothetical protein